MSVKKDINLLYAFEIPFVLPFVSYIPIYKYNNVRIQI